MSHLGQETTISTRVPSAQALDLMPMAAFVTDARGVILHYNRLAAELWERAPMPGSPTAGQGGDGSRVVLADGSPVPPDQTPIARVLRDGVTRSEQELIVQRPDGGRVWLSLNVGPVWDANAQVAGAVCCFQDVTTRKSVERAFQEADSRYRRIVETSMEGIWSFGRDGRTTYANQHMARMLGYGPEEVLGRRVEEFVFPEDREAVARRVERLVAGEAQRHDTRLRHKDGTAVHLSVSSCPFRDARGEFAGAFATFTDITERRAAAALHAGQRRVLEMLATGCDLESVLAALVATIEAQAPGMVGSILLVDPADPTRLVLGTCRSLPEGCRAAVGDLPIAPDGATCGAAAFHRAVRVTADISADPNWAGTADLPIANGLRAAWSVPILTGSGELLGTFGSYFREVRRPTPAQVKLVEDAAYLAGIAIEQHRTQRELVGAKEAAERAREEAEAASRAKDDFLAALSHELRTPLSPVLLTASALAHDPSLPRAVRDEVELIQRSVELEARLIDDLLDLTRITRGKLQLHLEPVDAHALIRQSMQTCCGSDVDNKSLNVDLGLGATYHTVLADPARLQQVLWNLVKNAVKFTPAGGLVTVLTRDSLPVVGESPADGHRLIVEVRDTGIGIEAEAIPTIFNAFQQADGTIVRRFGGLGLGLAICKSLVELHGGTIRASSDGAGHGSTFTLELPAAAVGASADPHHPPTSAVPRGLKILLVEDHEHTLKVLTKLLRRMEHEVLPAANCRDAIEAMSGGTEFDVLISDIGLPDGSGLEIVRELRPRQPHVKAIALSGFGMDHDIRRSLEAGFHTHLVKPVHIEKLKGVIAQLFA